MGIVLVILSVPCLFASMYFANFKFNMMKATEWLAAGMVLLSIAYIIT